MSDFFESLEIRFHDAPWNDCYEIAFFAKEGGRTWVSEPIAMKERTDHGIIYPTARMSRNAMQGLFNELWKAGFRPKDGTGNSGHVEALKYHLEDMRKLVFVTTRSKVEATQPISGGGE
jgi:hypothetical protein